MSPVMKMLGLKAPFHLRPAEGGILHVLPGPSSENPNHFVPWKRKPRLGPRLLQELDPLWLALRSVASPISQAKETQDKWPIVLSISIPKQMLPPPPPQAQCLWLLSALLPLP